VIGSSEEVSYKSLNKYVARVIIMLVIVGIFLF